MKKILLVLGAFALVAVMSFTNVSKASAADSTSTITCDRANHSAVISADGTPVGNMTDVANGCFDTSVQPGPASITGELESVTIVGEIENIRTTLLAFRAFLTQTPGATVTFDKVETLTLRFTDGTSVAIVEDDLNFIKELATLMIGTLEAKHKLVIDANGRELDVSAVTSRPTELQDITIINVPNPTEVADALHAIAAGAYDDVKITVSSGTFTVREIANDHSIITAKPAGDPGCGIGGCASRESKIAATASVPADIALFSVVALFALAGVGVTARKLNRN